MPDDLSAFNDVECKNHNLPCQQFVWRGKGGWGGSCETRVKLHSPPHFAAHSRTYKTTSYAGYKNIISRQTLNVLLPGRLTYEEIVTR